MQLKHPAKAEFYAALAAAARQRGVLQKDLARELQLHPSILSRRIQGQGPLDGEAKVLQVIRTLGLDAAERDLRRLWREAHAAIYDCEPQAEITAGAEKTDDTLLREYHRLLPEAEQGKGLPRLIRVCLELSTLCHQQGRWGRAFGFADQAFEVAHADDDRRLQVVTQHELALVARLGDLEPSGATVNRFSDLIRTYQQALPQRTVGEDALARAYRDAARAAARDAERWDQADQLLRVSAGWAGDAHVPDRSQLFHTRLDRCALAVLRGDRTVAERELNAADQLRGTAARARETWFDPRTDAKHGLVGAAVSGLSGDRDHCIQEARYWLERWEDAAGIQSLETAQRILAWANDNFESPLPPTALLR